MFIDIVEIIPKKGRSKRYHRVSCDLDICKNIWEIPFRENRKKDKLDFCCKEHQYKARVKNGSFDLKLKNICTEKYGVDSTNKLECIKKKAQKTRKDIYGDPNFNNRKKASSTCLEKYGVENPFQSSELKAKIKKTLLKKYGVESPIKNEEIKEKIKNVMLEKYGVEHAWNIPAHRERNKSKEIRDKIHETMKKNGSYKNSKMENKFYEYLLKEYPKKNIERQASVNGWSIDFKIEEVYIQFDGVYWHGLDRPINEIVESNDPRDKTILETFKRDNKQNEWFKNKGLRLIRITDLEFENNLLEKIEELK